jgi:hypothetical protein
MTSHLSCDAKQCAGLTKEQLYDLVQYEFPRIPIIRNAPLGATSQKNGDHTDFMTTIKNGYLQNVCQRYVFGVESERNFDSKSSVMVNYLGYPKFKNPEIPTLRESNDRMLYLANNWDKKHCGNFQNGAVTYVINPIYSDRFFVAPGDTGVYHAEKLALGTMEDFNHVITQHLSIYGYQLSATFDSWYEGKANPACSGKSDCYFEIEFSGSSWVPESLLYIIVKAGKSVGQPNGLFGTTEGRTLEDWMRTSRRPLVWADGDHSGMLLDPYVDWLGFNGKKYIVDADRTFWATAWTSKTPFTTLYSTAVSHLKMEYRSYFTKEICDKDENSPGKMIMGVLEKDKLCVFWAWEGDLDKNPLFNQQWIGPSIGTKNAIFFKHACNNTVCGKCLDLSNNGNTTNGNVIDIYDCTGGQSQQWTFDTSTSQIKYLANTKKCIDVAGGDMANGNKLQVGEYDVNPTQPPFTCLTRSLHNLSLRFGTAILRYHSSGTARAHSSTTTRRTLPSVLTSSAQT